MDRERLDDWHPLMLERDLPDNRPVGTRLLGEDLVVWCAGREVLAWQDVCVHRGTRVVENFLDIAHFALVHAGTLGVRERPEIEDYEATLRPDGVEARGVRVFQPDPYGTRVGDTVS